MLMSCLVGRGSVGFMILAAGAACCQDYPSKPIRFVTTAAGGGNDIQTRFIAPVMSVSLGAPIVVDNRAGAAVATEHVAKSPADGYTLLYAGQTTWLTPLLQKAPYDMQDLYPISQVAREIYILTVHPSLPVKSVKDLVALAKSRPGQLNYGSGPTGSPGHMGMELLKSLSGINIVWIPYKGTQAALTAEMGGEVQMMMANPGLVLPQIQAGKVKALAITSSAPSELFPNLPTVAASGVPGYEMVLLTGVFAPTKTPRPIVNRLSQEIVRALNQPDVKQKFLTSGVEAAGSLPEQLDAAVKADIAKMAKVIRDAHIKVEQ